MSVDGKSNQITAFVPLLDRLADLTNVVISADMMHTQRGHARYLHRRGAYFVLPVGGNQAALSTSSTPLPGPRCRSGG